MDRSQIFILVGIFTIRTVSGKLLKSAGYENAPLMVLASGLIAGGALAYLSLTANRRR